MNYKIETTGGEFYFNNRTEIDPPLKRVRRFIERNKGKREIRVYSERQGIRWQKDGKDVFPRWQLIQTIKKATNEN